MKNKILSLYDLDLYLSKRKKSFHFTTNEDAEAIVVQVPGTITFSEDNYDPTTGLLPTHLQTCHIGVNRNHSNIDKEVMEECMSSIYNRPIMGFIHQLSDGTYDFAGHEMFLNDDNEIEYEEISVGTIPESCNPQLIYDEEKKKTYLEVDGYIYEDYTRAADILKEKKESKVSVELALLDFSFNAKDKVLDINKFYFSGVTILGKSRYNEEPIEEGMLGSNIKLKDFSSKNNSLFSSISDEENNKLIDVIEKLNMILSNLNINNIVETEDRKEVNNNMEDVKILNEENTVETEQEETVIENETEVNTEIEIKAEENKEVSLTETESETTVENAENNSIENYTKNFELSHDDIRCALYNLLAPYEEANNDWYWIVEVYNDYFIYEGLGGSYWGQKYTTENDNVAFSGEPYKVYSEFLTESEHAALAEMRSNYSSIKEELSRYKEEEDIQDKMTVFQDEAYSNYLDTKEFKSLMDREILKKFSKEELIEKSDAALGKLVKSKMTFSTNTNENTKQKPSFFNFAAIEEKSSFLDGLLNK